MNSVKIFTIVASFFFIGLYVPVAAMKVVPQGKEIIGFTYKNWQQALNALSNPTNWNRNVPTDEWMRSAIKPAVQSIQQDKRKTEVMNELDSALREHYGSSLSKAQSSALPLIKRDFLASINTALATAEQLQRQREQEERKEQKRIMQQWLQEAHEKAARYEQKVEGEEKLVTGVTEVRYDIARKTELGDFSQALLDLAKEENWYEDESIPDWIERLVPTQQWMEKATDSVIKIIREDKATENQIIVALRQALEDHYKFSKNATTMTIELAIDRFIKLLNKKLYPEQDKQTRLGIRTAAQRRAFEEQESMPQEKLLKLTMEQKQITIRDSIEYIKQSPLFEQFKQLLTLDSVGKGWFRAPLPRWKDDIVQAAFELLKSIKDTYGRVDDVIRFVVSQIDDAIINYAKTKSYFPDWTLIAMDRKEIGDKITTLINYDPSRRIELTFANKLLFPKTTSEQEMYEQAIEKAKQHDVERAQEQELKGFTAFFRNIARGETDEQYTPEKEYDVEMIRDIEGIYWFFNPIKTYYDLNPITLKKIVDEAVTLIKEKNVPLKTIEHMMNKELQDARKGKSPKFRSAAGLGIIKAIKEQL